MVRLKTIVLNPDQKRHRRKQTLLSLELIGNNISGYSYIQRRRIQLSQVMLDLIAFKHLPVVAFRRCPNLRDLLVSAKLPSNSTNPNPQLPCGSFRVDRTALLVPTFQTDLLAILSFLPVKRALSNLT